MLRFYSKPNNGSRVTVIGKHEDNVLTIGVSRCGEHDAFNRAKGVKIAESRIEGGKHYMKIPMQERNPKVFDMIARGIADRVTKTKIVY
jgi:hypothetical protein